MSWQADVSFSLRNKLSAIQTELKAPKNLRNTFGGYNYRNAEGILEAFKPYEAKYKVTLVLTDEVVIVGERVYVKAEARLCDCESDAIFTVTAYAREPESKKGMDESQITGAASSYARKYALNGLFLLDDTKDADSDEYQRESEGRSNKKKDANAETEVIDAKAVATLRGVFTEKLIDERFVCTIYKIKTLENCTQKIYVNIMKNIDKIIEKQKEEQK